MLIPVLQVASDTASPSNAFFSFFSANVSGTCDNNALKDDTLSALVFSRAQIGLVVLFVCEDFPAADAVRLDDGADETLLTTLLLRALQEMEGFLTCAHRILPVA